MQAKIIYYKILPNKLAKFVFVFYLFVSENTQGQEDAVKSYYHTDTVEVKYSLVS